jgi:mRNA-degrading endonuclease RelE of RelBE toxin-antitoxin system
METKVELSEQVVRFIARRAPEPRRAMRAALRALARERGDIRALESPLSDYHQLLVGGYRIIFAYRVRGKRRGIQCIYAERRDAVYEVFAQLLKKHLLEGEKQ